LKSNFFMLAVVLDYLAWIIWNLYYFAICILSLNTLYIRVGWYWNWDKSTPEVCYIPFKSNENKRKKWVDPVTASSLVKTFWVMHYIEVPHFFHNMDFMGIKRCRILCRFQKYKLALVTKCT
jgi:hypothetical protein